MQRRSRTRQSWALFDCLRSQEQGGQQGFSPTSRSGPPICSQRRLSTFRRRRSTPQLGQGTCWTPPPPQLHPRPRGGDCQGELEPPDPPRQPPAPVFPPRPPPPPGSRGVGGACVTVDSSDNSGSEDAGGGQPHRPGEAGVRICPRPPGRNPYTPLQVPGTPASGGSHGETAGRTPGPPGAAGALWSGGRSPASTHAHGPRAAGAGSFNGEGRG